MYINFHLYNSIHLKDTGNVTTKVKIYFLMKTYMIKKPECFQIAQEMLINFTKDMIPYKFNKKNNVYVIFMSLIKIITYIQMHLSLSIYISKKVKNIS